MLSHSFQSDSVEVVLTCLPIRGAELSWLSVDKGIPPRKGEEEEDEGEVLCGAGRMRRRCLNAHTHTRPLFSLVSLATVRHLYCSYVYRTFCNIRERTGPRLFPG